jgi:uncharacterized protein (DUF1501 family)
MKRRSFIKTSGAVAGGTLLLNGIPVKAGNMPSQMAAFTCAEIRDRVTVLVNLFGANDSLNTLVPVAQYDLYATKRPKIKIPNSGTNSYLNLDTTLAANRQSGLHPVMTGIKALYDQGKVNVVHGVGYANGNKSHFKSDDLWNTNGDSTPSNFSYTSGWAAELFDFRYPGLIGTVNPQMPDPPCVELGYLSSSLLFTTSSFKNASVLLTNNNVDYYYTNLVNVGGVPPTAFPVTDHGDDIKYIDEVQKLSNSYGQRLQTVFNTGNNSATVTYPDTYIAGQLKTVARLIKGGAKTSLYQVRQYGYDTHGQQVEENNTITGDHAKLLKELSDAIKAFQDDLKDLGLEDRVLTATYSEFGRTVDENDSFGTDHGEVSTMFIIGKGVVPGVTGNPIDLTKVTNRGLTDLQYDYRRVWAAVMQDFMGHGDNPMAAARLDSFLTQKAPIIAATHKADPSCYINQQILPISLVQFTGKLNAVNSNVDLFWETLNENNNREFIVEFKDGNNWVSIGNINGAGNSAVSKNYTFSHKQPKAGENQYRLRQIDFAGNVKIYGPIIVKVDVENVFVVKNFPNPASSEFSINITTQKTQMLTLQFLDHLGHVIAAEKLSATSGINRFRYPVSRFNNYKGELIIVIQSSLGMKQVLRQQIL